MNPVVKLYFPEPSIAVVILEDRLSSNTFSKGLIAGLVDAFDQIHQNETLKAVIIHGYDNFFCCGGTKEELLNIYLGKITFADLSFYRLLLDCEIPTIAAMQGHALGGGLAFGCYADFVILSEECLYSANFMKYGFTPGMGATYMIAKKFGEPLAHEMLFSAQNYYGKMLKARGILVNVVEKKAVIQTAMDLAKELADKPRNSLKVLKQHLTQKIKQELPQVIEQELAMHCITFTGQEVKERIETLFGR